MESTSNRIRLLTRDDTDRAAHVLARAFSVSPTYLRLFSHLDEAARARALSTVKRGFVDASIRYHVARGLFSGDELRACMLTMRPGEYPLPFSSEAIQTIECAKTGIRAGLNFLKIRSHFVERHIHEPHHYLFVLGVDTRHQRQGLGRALLAELTRDCEADDVPAYLETDTDDNVRLYSSVGFEIGTDELAKGLDLRVITMRRPSMTERRANLRV